MEYCIIAQVIGFIGYLFYVSAPQFKAQRNILRVGFVGYIILGMQWFLLGQYGLLILNLLGAIVSVSALYVRAKPALRRYVWGLYPFGVVCILLFCEGTVVDVLAIAAFMLTVRSQMSQNVIEFRGTALFAGAILISSSLLAMSVPAVIFNTVFVCVHMGHLARLYMSKTGTALAYAKV